MPRVLVPDAASRGTVRLRGAPLRHLRTVLRMAPGDRLEVFDGEGRAFLAEIRAMSGTAAEIAVLEEIDARTESPLSLTLAVALPKGAKLDWVVEKATELGVREIVPFVSTRTVGAGREAGSRLGRWRRIATAATTQSGRAVRPEVAEPRDFHDVLALGAKHDLGLLFREGTRARLERRQPAPGKVIAVTGPEGGFAPEEARAAERAGFRVMGLGPRILRAETAPLVVATVCQWMWGDLGIETVG